MTTHDDHVAELQSRLDRAVADAPDLTEILRGSVGERFVRCGKPGCRCQDGPGHGPVYFLSVSLGAGKTKQVTLAEADYDLARRFANNYARLREIIEEVSTVNQEIFRKRRRGGRSHRDPGGE